MAEEHVMEQEVITVSALVQRIKAVLDASPALQNIWIKGEISNLRSPSSGHRYFTLKDEAGKIRCVLFRTSAKRVTFELEDGLTVLVRGSVSVYEAAGDVQVYVEEMLPAGQGALHLAFQQLKERLRREGLFEKKRPLPFFPRRIALITSPTGAAVRDMISVIRRRNPTVDILLIPAVVQGDAAPESLCNAFARVANLPVDLVIFGRGGGSLEELWAFNDERVARAVYACPVPTISAVGHETDFTIADFVADRRAPTPSAAAEMAVPEWQSLRAGVHDLHVRNVQAMERRLRHLRDRLRLLTSSAALTQPDSRIRQAYQRVDDLTDRMVRAWQAMLEERRARLQVATGKLDSLSPLATLSRGYAICIREATGEIVRRAAAVVPGERLQVRVAEGRIRCVVAGDPSQELEERLKRRRAASRGDQMQLPIV